MKQMTAGVILPSFFLFFVEKTLDIIQLKVYNKYNR